MFEESFGADGNIFNIMLLKHILEMKFTRRSSVHNSKIFSLRENLNSHDDAVLPAYDAV